jgi:nucleotide-binding universal stress UspA family protein
MKTIDNNRVKRILCPFDFSTTSLGGLEYAARLARTLQASLTVFYIRSSNVPEETQLYQDQNDLNKGIRRQLRNEMARIETRFGITPEICIESTVEGSELSIGEASAAYDLTVMGTNGADEMHEHIFGNGAHHRLGLAKCPVLLIPPKCPPRMPRRIVYAFDPETNPVHLLTDLEALAVPLGAEIRSLYIVPEPGVKETFASPFPEAMIGVHDKWGFDWDLDPICSDEVVAAIDKHMRHHKNDILALSCHHRPLFERLFQENVIDEFSRMATYPILVFWH